MKEYLVFSHAFSKFSGLHTVFSTYLWSPYSKTLYRFRHVQEDPDLVTDVVKKRAKAFARYSDGKTSYHTVMKDDEAIYYRDETLLFHHRANNKQFIAVNEVAMLLCDRYGRCEVVYRDGDTHGYILFESNSKEVVGATGALRDFFVAVKKEDTTEIIRLSNKDTVFSVEGDEVWLDGNSEVLVVGTPKQILALRQSGEILHYKLDQNEYLRRAVFLSAVAGGNTVLATAVKTYVEVDVVTYYKLLWVEKSTKYSTTYEFVKLQRPAVVLAEHNGIRLILDTKGLSVVRESKAEPEQMVPMEELWPWLEPEDRTVFEIFEEFF